MHVNTPPLFSFEIKFPNKTVIVWKRNKVRVLSKIDFSQNLIGSFKTRNLQRNRLLRCPNFVFSGFLFLRSFSPLRSFSRKWFHRSTDLFEVSRGKYFPLYKSQLSLIGNFWENFRIFRVILSPVEFS